jgi:hypothetical protein
VFFFINLLTIIPRTSNLCRLHWSSLLTMFPFDLITVAIVTQSIQFLSYPLFLIHFSPYFNAIILDVTSFLHSLKTISGQPSICVSSETFIALLFDFSLRWKAGLSLHFLCSHRMLSNLNFNFCNSLTRRFSINLDDCCQLISSIKCVCRRITLTMVL